MRCIYWISIMLVLVSADLVLADEVPRRTNRVASGPVRSAPEVELQKERLTPKPAVAPSVARPALLEPTSLIAGVGRGMVACFQVSVEEAVAWQLVVRETDGPVAQVFEGQGPPPGRIPWDGRLLDGGLAWSGMNYTYDLAFVDSSGDVGEMSGTDFKLPKYSREERQGISFLMTGRTLAAGRRGDPAATAPDGLESVAEQLNRGGEPATVRIEVLARDETTAMTLGEAVRATLAGLLDPGDRALDLYVGIAAAAPSEGTVLITTVPLAIPPS